MITVNEAANLIAATLSMDEMGAIFIYHNGQEIYQEEEVTKGIVRTNPKFIEALEAIIERVR